MSEVAVLLIIFNRPSNTRRVFDALKQIRPKRLYIAADAPRIHIVGEQGKCLETRGVTEDINWDCEVKRLYQDVNLGCSLGPRTAFQWFFLHEKEGIILEDDCLPHPDFFPFASEMLEKYRNNPRIISINGSNLGYKPKFNHSYTYSRFMNMWGWATWANRAKAIDYNLSQWKTIKHPLWFLYTKMNQYTLDTDIHWYQYWQHKFDLTTTKEKITWWDWQWIYHQLVHRQLSVVPSVNLITNIGFDTDATHTQAKDNPAANIPTEPLSFPLIHPNKLQADFVYEEKYVKWVWCYHKRLPFSFYLKRFLSHLFK